MYEISLWALITLVALKAIIGIHWPWEKCECCGRKYKDHHKKDSFKVPNFEEEIKRMQKGKNIEERYKMRPCSQCGKNWISKGYLCQNCQIAEDIKNSTRKVIEIVFIGNEYYSKSRTVSSVYQVDDVGTLTRTDWGFIRKALANGEELHIRPATKEELKRMDCHLRKLIRERKE